ncbi:MAG: NADH-quinone oxidoreductase subunit C [Clostridiales Family XIII bacterium]|jgi:ech hydrogenase subunit D|nr:NADH-quinone oxidoreductase subunit C [Clostridiales Family XIII bacterium]
MSEAKHLIQNFVPVEASGLLDAVQDMKQGGYRLGQICASSVKGEFQIVYSFDRDHVLTNLRLTPADTGAIPSITHIYWPAFIYENEMQDLFGFRFKNLALDYEGKFFKVSEPTPWNPKKAEGGEEA